MNLRSHFLNYFLNYLPCNNSPHQVETHNNTYWGGIKVEKMTPLPGYTYTSLSLKSLTIQDPTDTSSITAWDKAKSSRNIAILSNEPTKLHRHPVTQSTDIAMTNTCFSKGIHALEVEWPTQMRGTHAVIGVALKGMPSNERGYTNLLGSTKSSWGWDINKLKLLHNGESFGNYPKDKSDKKFTVPEKIRCVIDMNAGTIGFIIDGQYLGDAFSGLKANNLYLAVSSVWGHAEIKVKNIKVKASSLSLQDLSMLTSRNLIKYKEKLDALDIAPGLKKVITMESQSAIPAKNSSNLLINID